MVCWYFLLLLNVQACHRKLPRAGLTALSESALGSLSSWKLRTVTKTLMFIGCRVQECLLMRQRHSYELPTPVIERVSLNFQRRWVSHPRSSANGGMLWVTGNAACDVLGMRGDERECLQCGQFPFLQEVGIKVNSRKVLGAVLKNAGVPVRDPACRKLAGLDRTPNA